MPNHHFNALTPEFLDRSPLEAQIDEKVGDLRPLEGGFRVCIGPTCSEASDFPAPGT